MQLSPQDLRKITQSLRIVAVQHFIDAQRATTARASNLKEQAKDLIKLANRIDSATP